jgi:hypothetical protein
MPRRIIAATPQESLRPLTQALVATIETLMDEIAALRNHESGPWVLALEDRVMKAALDLDGRGAEADSVQVAQSALRACMRELRAQLHAPQPA